MNSVIVLYYNVSSISSHRLVFILLINIRGDTWYFQNVQKLIHRIYLWKLTDAHAVLNMFRLKLFFVGIVYLFFIFLSIRKILTTRRKNSFLCLI